MRNIVVGLLFKRFGFEEGVILKRFILEFCYKNDVFYDF